MSLRRVYLLSLLLVMASTAWAQFKTPGTRLGYTYCMCDFVGRGAGPSADCSSPYAIPKIGEKVIWYGDVGVGSGFHTHEFVFAPTGGDPSRPGNDTGPSYWYLADKGETYTGINGCTTNTVSVPNYAGTYKVGAYGENFPELVKEVQFEAGFTGLSVFPNTPYTANEGDLAHTDSAHSDLNFYVYSGIAGIQGKLLAIAQQYYNMHPDQGLDYLRASLPEGGIADNDIGPFGYYGQIIPGRWDDSVRFNEEHNEGSSVDVVNPSSKSGDMQYFDFSRVTDFLSVAAANGCGPGVFQPGGLGEYEGVPLMATSAWWTLQPYIHLVCRTEHTPPRKPARSNAIIGGEVR